MSKGGSERNLRLVSVVWVAIFIHCLPSEITRIPRFYPGVQRHWSIMLGIPRRDYIDEGFEGSIDGWRLYGFEHLRIFMSSERRWWEVLSGDLRNSVQRVVYLVLGDWEMRKRCEDRISIWGYYDVEDAFVVAVILARRCCEVMSYSSMNY